MTTTTLPPFFNYHVGTDTKPYMLVKQVSEKKVIVKSMNHEILPEGYEPKEGEYTRSQESMEKGGITWLITPNDNGIERTLSLRKTGQWCEVGQPSGHNEVYFRPSQRPDYYYDYCF